MIAAPIFASFRCSWREDMTVSEHTSAAVSNIAQIPDGQKRRVKIIGTPCRFSSGTTMSNKPSRCLRRRCSEGVFREMKLRGHYEKPSERRVREKAEAIRRARKLARKKLQREGLLPMKPRVVPGAPGKGGPARTPRF